MTSGHVLPGKQPKEKAAMDTFSFVSFPRPTAKGDCPQATFSFTTLTSIRTQRRCRAGNLLHRDLYAEWPASPGSLRLPLLPTVHT